MPDLHISRAHSLGLHHARSIAFRWAEQAEHNLGMQCTYKEGEARDCVEFTRTGVQGTLLVTDCAFELHAKLGFLLGTFKNQIQAEVEKNLDELLATADREHKKPTPRSR